MNKIDLDAFSISSNLSDENRELLYATMGNMENLEDMEHYTPQNICEKVMVNLSPMLQEIVNEGSTLQLKDMLLFSSLVVLSGAFPQVYGIYDRHKVHPNLYGFLVAPAASSKGMLSACQKLVEGIEQEIRHNNEMERQQYEQDFQRYALDVKKNPDLLRPHEPPYRSLFIPANGSATATYQALNDNNEWGITFETEGDTVAYSLKSDYGNYSDGLRVAAHHEPIKYNRRKEHEHVNIQCPKWTVFLTGTPAQVKNVIPNSENGLFSRFLFLRIERNLIWRNVFDDNEETIDEVFQHIGLRVLGIYHLLQEKQGKVCFRLTPQQQEQFNDFFANTQEEYSQLMGDDFIASVRRLGLSCFRLAMVMSITRLAGATAVPDIMECSDEDFNTALTMTEVLIDHAAHIFATQTEETQEHVRQQLNLQQRQLLNSLPQEFGRKEFKEVAKKVGIREKTAEKHLGKFMTKYNLIVRVSHGHYKKMEHTKAT